MSSDSLVLWDHCPTSSAISFHPSKFRNLTLLVKEKILSLGCRFLENDSRKNGYFIGTVQSDKEGSALVVSIDTFDENLFNTKPLIPGDIWIPFCIRKVGEVSTVFQNSEDLLLHLKKLHNNYSASSEVTLSNSLCLFVNCTLQGARCIISVNAISSGVEFKATSIAPIPIQKSTLSQNLESECLRDGFSAKSGLITIDSSKKIHLLMDTDPRIATIPLVGVWVSKVSSIDHPFVWSACLRYITCSDYTERLCLPPKPFLLIVYSTVNREPIFYDCFTSNGLTKESFTLKEGTVTTAIPKIPSFNSKILHIELQETKVGKLIESIRQASERLGIEKPPAKPSIMEGKISSNVADIPRSTPRYPSPNTYTLKPLVPDVSLLSDNGQDPVIRLYNRTSLKTVDRNISPAIKTDYGHVNIHKTPKRLNTSPMLNSGVKGDTANTLITQPKFTSNHSANPLECMAYKGSDNAYSKPSEYTPITPVVNSRLAPKFFTQSVVSPTPNLIVNSQPKVIEASTSNEPVINQNIAHSTETRITPNPSSEITDLLKNQDEQLRNLQEQVQKLLKAQEIHKPSPEDQIQPVTNSEPAIHHQAALSLEPSPNSQLFNLLQHQDEQLLKLQDQVKQMLDAQNILARTEIEMPQARKANNSNCSVGVMTSIMYPERSLSSHKEAQKLSENAPSAACAHCNCQKINEIHLNKSLEQPNLDQFGDRSSSQILVDLPEFSFTQIHNNTSELVLDQGNNENDSLNKNEKGPTTFYRKLLNNVNQLLDDSQTECGNEPRIQSGQQDSIYIPRLNYQTLYLKENEPSTSNYSQLDTLTMKYLGKKNPSVTGIRKTAVKGQHTPERKVENFGTQLKGVSFATKAYLEKHNLSNNVVDESATFQQIYVTPHPIKTSNPRNGRAFGNDISRVLNIEELRRQPKLL